MSWFANRSTCKISLSIFPVIFLLIFVNYDSLSTTPGTCAELIDANDTCDDGCYGTCGTCYSQCNSGPPGSECCPEVCIIRHAHWVCSTSPDWQDNCQWDYETEVVVRTEYKCDCNPSSHECKQHTWRWSNPSGGYTCQCNTPCFSTLTQITILPGADNCT